MFVLFISILGTCAVFATLSQSGAVENPWWNVPSVVCAFLLAYVFWKKSQYEKTARNIMRYATSSFIATATLDFNELVFKFLEINAGILIPKTAHVTYSNQVETAVQATWAFWGALVWGIISLFMGEIFSALICIGVVALYLLLGVRFYFCMGDDARDSIAAAKRWFKMSGVDGNMPPKEKVKEAASLYAKCLVLLKYVREDLNKPF